MMGQYKGVPLGELSPHVYAIAEKVRCTKQAPLKTGLEDSCKLAVLASCSCYADSQSCIDALSCCRSFPLLLTADR